MKKALLCAALLGGAIAVVSSGPAYALDSTKKIAPPLNWGSMGSQCYGINLSRVGTEIVFPSAGVSLLVNKDVESIQAVNFEGAGGAIDKTMGIRVGDIGTYISKAPRAKQPTKQAANFEAKDVLLQSAAINEPVTKDHYVGPMITARFDGLKTLDSIIVDTTYDYGLSLAVHHRPAPIGTDQRGRDGEYIAAT
ncbi:MAG TPA: hypothetical protein VG984_00635 [Candidatus Paceibacterota bacterium]|nr:hypothetical protein [Candidatus Paceibacterota bacterium]